MKKISIVSPCYNEEKNIQDLCARLEKVFNKINVNPQIKEKFSYELIFADDNSSDKSTEIIKKLALENNDIKLVVNHQNYGVYKNTFNALKYATGDALIPMLPVDMQDPPELIETFISKWLEGNDVVVGTRYDREENFLMKTLRRIYYRIASKFSDINLVKYAGEFQLLDRKIYKELVKIDDYYPYIRGLIATITSDYCEVPYKWEQRNKGKSNYKISDYYDHAINGIVSTSTSPLRKLSFYGIVLSTLLMITSLVQGFIFLFINNELVSGGTVTVLFIVSIFSFLILLSVSVMSEYVSAIHNQVRRNFKVIEKEKINL
jgi:polyisoprenyl-phosphate glycosyltransferase